MAKSLAELKAIREKTFKEISLRHGKNGYRVVVSTSTAAIAAGARSVVVKLMEEIDKRDLVDITLLQNGWMESSSNEPIVEVHDTSGKKVTYANVSPEKAAKIADEHLTQGKVVQEYAVKG